MQVQLPEWLETVEDGRKATERTRFLLRLAALMVGPEGSLSELSRRCGLTENTLATVAKREGRVSPEIANLVDKAVNDGNDWRELLRPDLFARG